MTDDFDSLKIISLKHIISNLTKSELEAVFNNYDMDDLCLIKEVIDNESKKHQITYCVLCNDKPGRGRFSDLALNFINNYKKDDYNPLSLLHDPILVLTTLLLGSSANGPNTEWYVEVIKINLFEEYIIDKTKWIEKIKIQSSTNKYLFIPERPPTLFEDLRKYANDHNIKLDLSRVEEFPKIGPYRIFD